MSFKEVNSLRKSGQLAQAAKMSKADILIDPFDEWNKRGALWVYYEYMKIALAKNEISEFLKQLEKITNLKLPENEKIAFDAVAWAVGKLLFANETLGSSVLSNIYKLIKDFNFSKPKDSYSFLLKAFKKHSDDWQHFIEFVNWWGLNNFQKNDYENFVLDNGKKIPSLVESIFILISKKLISDTTDKHAIEAFLPNIKRICVEYPKMQYTHYYHAKLLIAVGNKDRFLSAFLPFAKKKLNDFWVWDLLSQIFEKNSMEYYACLSRSLLCGAPTVFALNVKEKMAELLIEKKLFAEAKYEILDVISCRTNNQWRLTKNLEKWIKEDWWRRTEAVKNKPTNIYQPNVPIAEGLLFYDTPMEVAVVESINYEKQFISFVISKDKYGFFSYRGFKIAPKVGKCLNVRFDSSEKAKLSRFYKVISLSLSEQNPPKTIFKNIKGIIKIKEGNSFGFVSDIFVPPNILKTVTIANGTPVEIGAIISFNAKNKKWGWKAISICTEGF